ncbi:MAG: hypothetical protein HQ557_03650 [Bacteroidetes bacterium]|nr:hypothetical protein [Bacteroidota bacterium]
MENILDNLQVQKETILQQIGELGEFRQGSLSPRYRKCGKPYCHCAQEGSKGHGPLWMITRSINGKTNSKAIPREEAATTFKQIDTFHQFQSMVREYIETNIKICDARLANGKAASLEAKKKG